MCDTYDRVCEHPMRRLKAYWYCDECSKTDWYRKSVYWYHKYDNARELARTEKHEADAWAAKTLDARRWANIRQAERDKARDDLQRTRAHMAVVNQARKEWRDDCKILLRVAKAADAHYFGDSNWTVYDAYKELVSSIDEARKAGLL